MTLTIKYIIDLLNVQNELKIERKKYLIDLYPTLKINYNITYYNLLSALLIACKNTNYKIDNTTLKISLLNDIEEYFKIIEEFIRTSSIDTYKKKKYIQYLSMNNKDTSIQPTNDIILILTHYFGINLIIYNTETQIIKLYYYDNLINTKLPYIILKETKELNTIKYYYEIIFSQNKYIFDNTHPLIIELIHKAIIVGFEQNKKLELIELRNINEDLTEIQINTIVLTNMPSKYIKLIKENQNKNIEKINLY
jgi:hypothetical protein